MYNYTFNSDVLPVINVTLCGVPAPILHWTFHNGATMVATREPINTYTYKYLIHLPNITQKTCGVELSLNATGTDKIKKTISVFPAKCKC